jgi:hypothetical protein
VTVAAATSRAGVPSCSLWGEDVDERMSAAVLLVTS